MWYMSVHLMTPCGVNASFSVCVCCLDYSYFYLWDFNTKTAKTKIKLNWLICICRTNTSLKGQALSYLKIWKGVIIFQFQADNKTVIDNPFNCNDSLIVIVFANATEVRQDKRLFYLRFVRCILFCLIVSVKHINLDE